LDSQYRWVHNKSGYNTCLKSKGWVEKLCPDGPTCAARCAVDGVDLKGYRDTYGIKGVDGGLEMRFGSKGKYGMNYGSRVYVLGDHEHYKVWMLKNREFSFDVDVSHLPCGLNGAVYFIAMDSHGERGTGENTAGAKYGLGYCDAMCPRGQRFLYGEANTEEWDPKTSTGRYGACCPELDIWEANRNATAMTVHKCDHVKPMRCTGKDCSTACDRDGCQFNPFEAGHHGFYGPGLILDTNKPFTVVTQFVTEDGSDDGALVDIRRHYVQDGRIIENPDSLKEGGSHCRAGLMKHFGAVLEQGMVLALSLWDDTSTQMTWLDSPSSLHKSAMKGPCFGRAENIRKKETDSYVRYLNLRHGEIGSTAVVPAGLPWFCQPWVLVFLGAAAVASAASWAVLQVRAGQPLPASLQGLLAGLTRSTADDSRGYAPPSAAIPESRELGAVPEKRSQRSFFAGCCSRRCGRPPNA